MKGSQVSSVLILNEKSFLFIIIEGDKLLDVAPFLREELILFYFAFCK